MYLSHTPRKAHPHLPAHPLSLQEMAIIAAGLLVAMMVGVAASGVLPL
jgi:hypothetical protein